MPRRVPWFVITGLAGAGGNVALFMLLLRLVPQQPLLAAVTAVCFGAVLTWIVNRLFLRVRRGRVDAAVRQLQRVLAQHGNALPAHALARHLPLPPELIGRAVRVALHNGSVIQDGAVLRLPNTRSR